METYLSPRDTERMEQVASCLRDRLLIRLLSRSGCRISEALALKVEDIDLSVGTITIIHLKSRVKLFCPRCGMRLGRAHCFCPGCSNKVDQATQRQAAQRRLRVLPIDGGTVRMLRDYIKRGGPITRGGSKLLFGINRHRAWQIIRDCANRASLSPLINPETGKVRGISPHRLRDAFAIRAMKVDDSGDGLRLLQQHLGHSSFDTTARYRKIGGSEHRKWYNNLWREVSNHATT